jgi:predicted alpha/beta-hydrolase family hydrolase
MSETWTVPVGTESVSALHESSSTGITLATFVCAHGAGGNMHDRGVQAVAKELCGRGLDVVRFNFLYTEQKRGRPDPMPILQKVIEAVVEMTRRELSVSELIIGGRSMGGRAASMLAADGFAADRLLLLAYPLHPAGKPEQLRDAHLPRIAIPTLCINGTRDTLCRRDLMEQVLHRVSPRFRMHWVEGADHSFHVLKSSGRTDAQVMAEIGSAAQQWLSDNHPTP